MSSREDNATDVEIDRSGSDAVEQRDNAGNGREIKEDLIADRIENEINESRNFKDTDKIAKETEINPTAKSEESVRKIANQIPKSMATETMNREELGARNENMKSNSPPPTDIKTESKISATKLLTTFQGSSAPSAKETVLDLYKTGKRQRRTFWDVSEREGPIPYEFSLNRRGRNMPSQGSSFYGYSAGQGKDRGQGFSGNSRSGYGADYNNEGRGNTAYGERVYGQNVVPESNVHNLYGANRGGRFGGNEGDNGRYRKRSFDNYNDREQSQSPNFARQYGTGFDQQDDKRFRAANGTYGMQPKRLNGPTIDIRQTDEGLGLGGGHPSSNYLTPMNQPRSLPNLGGSISATPVMSSAGSGSISGGLSPEALTQAASLSQLVGKLDALGSLGMNNSNLGMNSLNQSVGGLAGGINPVQLAQLNQLLALQQSGLLNASALLGVGALQQPVAGNTSMLNPKVQQAASKTPLATGRQTQVQFPRFDLLPAEGAYLPNLYHYYCYIGEITDVASPKLTTKDIRGEERIIKFTPDTEVGSFSNRPDTFSWSDLTHGKTVAILQAKTKVFPGNIKGIEIRRDQLKHIYVFDGNLANVCNGILKLSLDHPVCFAANCNQQTRLEPCGDCNCCLYCSEDHQRRSWFDEGHDKMCAQMKVLNTLLKTYYSDPSEFNFTRVLSMV